MAKNSMAEVFTTFVHRYIPGQSSPYTLLLLHGTGGNEDSLLDLGAELMPSTGLLSVRGKVLEYGMPRFFRRFGEGIFDLEDLHFRTGELIEFIRDAAEEYDFDRTKVVAVGYSNGANIAASILFTDPHVLAGAIILRGMLPYVPDRPAQLDGTPVLLLSGDRDPIVPVQRAVSLVDALTAIGANVDHRSLIAAHSLVNADVTSAQSWLASNFVGGM